MRVSDGSDRLVEVERLLAAFRRDPDMASDNDLIGLRRDARAAIDRLDDEPEFNEAHLTLDEVGRHVRTTRPHLCFLARDGDGFTQTCRVWCRKG